MKTKDVEALNRVLECLDKGISIEQELLDAFGVAVANCNVKLAQQKRYYRENAERLRRLKKEWVENNPERQRKYQREWSRKKRQKELQNKAKEEENA